MIWITITVIHNDNKTGNIHVNNEIQIENNNFLFWYVDVVINIKIITWNIWNTGSMLNFFKRYFHP